MVALVIIHLAKTMVGLWVLKDRCYWVVIHLALEEIPHKMMILDSELTVDLLTEIFRLQVKVFITESLLLLERLWTWATWLSIKYWKGQIFSLKIQQNQWFRLMIWHKQLNCRRNKNRHLVDDFIKLKLYLVFMKIPYSII